jgi:hypothetical protein
MDRDAAAERRQAAETFGARARCQRPVPMAREAYRRTLQAAFQGEVLGEAAYAVAARLAWEPRRRRKWEALRQLEHRTQGRLAQALRDEGLPARAHLGPRVAGAVIALLAALVPRRLAMGMLGRAITVTQRWFERFEQEAADYDPRLLRSLVEHERAQGEFVRRERAGDEAGSITPILTLLHHMKHSSPSQ